MKATWPLHWDAGQRRPLVQPGCTISGVASERVALIADLLCADLDDSSKAVLRNRLVRRVAETPDEDELQEAGLSRCVVRLPVDFTGRRNTLLP